MYGDGLREDGASGEEQGCTPVEDKQASSLLCRVADQARGMLTSDGIKARCARGGAALAVGSVVERAARFARNVILARLLAPEEFGVMAIVIAVSGFFDALTEVGVRQAVVQNRRGDTDGFLNVAWWFSAVRGVGLYLVGYAIAPLAARFYADESLTAILRVVFLSLLLTGLTSARFFVLEKRLQFGWYVCLTQGAGFAGTVVSLVAALYIRNVWALVLGFVAEPAIRCLLSFAAFPMRPSLHLDRESLRDLIAFTRGMAGLPLLTCLAMQADVFVLGRVVSKETLGMYSLAWALANTPLVLFSKVIQPMILPVLAGMQNDFGRLRSAVLRTTRYVMLFSVPPAVCLVVFGRPILAVTYGRPYEIMALPFALLCVYFTIYVIGTVLVSTHLAIGRPEYQRRFLLIWTALVAAGIYPASRGFGPAGAAACLLVCLVMASIYQVIKLNRVILLPVRDYLAILGEGLIMAGLIVIPAIFLRLACGRGDIVQSVVAAGLCLLGWGVCALRVHGVGRVPGSVSSSAGAGGS